MLSFDYVIYVFLYAILGFLVCVCAYSVSTLEEFNPIKIGNLLIYVGLSGSELLLYNFVGELIKQYVGTSD